MSQDEIKLPMIGWREWVRLPELAIGRVKAKIDTGARSSCLHAFDIQKVEQDGELFVRFKVQPKQNRQSKLVEVEAKVLEFRKVRSSSGHIELRPVIVTIVSMQGHEWPIELTLTDRGAMRFRMLLGREALRGRFVIDPDQSFRAGKPKKKKKWERARSSK